MVRIIKEASPIQYIDRYDHILVGTNCYQSMRNGFQAEVKAMFPEAYEKNLQTAYGNPDKVGKVLDCGKVALCFISFGYNFKGGENNTYVDYDGLIKCLRYCNIIYKGKKLVTTLMGSTKFDGNGDRDKILHIFNETMTNVDVDIFDYTGYGRNEMRLKKFLKIKHNLV